MRIVRCSGCNRLIHMDKVCFFCASESAGAAVSQAEVHENARDSFALAENLAAQGRFDEAETALCEVMKWSPNSPEVHWLRLLVRAKCRNDRELLFSGTGIAKSPDYETALRYASDDEKQVYEAVESACAALNKTLVDMIKSRNDRIIEKLRLDNTLAQIQQFILEKRSALLAAWQELRKCEQELKLLENEGLYYIHECKNNMQSVRDESAEIRSSLENTPELGRKQYFLYKAKLESLKKTADIAKDEYYRLKSQHPSVASFAELCKKRGEIKSAIDLTLDEVKKYEKSIEAVIADMNAKKREGNILLEQAQAGNYEQVKIALGQNNFDRAVQYALSIK